MALHPRTPLKRRPADRQFLTKSNQSNQPNHPPQRSWKGSRQTLSWDGSRSCGCTATRSCDATMRTYLDRFCDKLAKEIEWGGGEVNRRSPGKVQWWRTLVGRPATATTQIKVGSARRCKQGDAGTWHIAGEVPFSGDHTSEAMPHHPSHTGKKCDGTTLISASVRCMLAPFTHVSKLGQNRHTPRTSTSAEQILPLFSHGLVSHPLLSHSSDLPQC